MYVHVTLNDYFKHIIYDIAMQYIQYRSNVMLHSLDTFLLDARSHSMFTISSLQVCSSKIALHLVYNKNFIKRGYLLKTICYIAFHRYHRVYWCFSKCEPASSSPLLKLRDL